MIHSSAAARGAALRTATAENRRATATGVVSVRIREFRVMLEV
jgi:hypothetical protein